MEDQEWLERLDEMAVMFNTEGWSYFLDMVEEMQERAENIADIKTVEDLYDAKGYSRALAQILNIESVVEQSRAAVE